MQDKQKVQLWKNFPEFFNQIRLLLTNRPQESPVEELSPEHKQLLADLRTEWTGIMLNTKPLDEDKAKQAITMLYLTNNLDVPEFVFVKSPMEATILSQQDMWNDEIILDSPGSPYFADGGVSTREIATAVWGTTNVPQPQRLPSNQLPGMGQFTNKWKDFKPPIVNELSTLSQMLIDLNVIIDSTTGRLTSHNMGHYCPGQFSAPLLAPESFATKLTHYTLPELTFLNMWANIARNTAWFWPYTNTCIISQRPTRLQLDDQQRMHSEDGPAIQFADGIYGYYWHGVRVPNNVIENPSEITPENIFSESNAEIRRAMMTLHGLDRCIEEMNAELLQSDGYGDLYSFALRGGRQMFVKLVNSTPEEDGTYKDYVIPVPRNMETAKEAVAWMVGMRPGEYEPEVQT